MWENYFFTVSLAIVRFIENAYWILSLPITVNYTTGMGHIDSVAIHSALYTRYFLTCSLCGRNCFCFTKFLKDGHIQTIIAVFLNVPENLNLQAICKIRRGVFTECCISWIIIFVSRSSVISILKRCRRNGLKVKTIISPRKLQILQCLRTYAITRAVD